MSNGVEKQGARVRKLKEEAKVLYKEVKELNKLYFDLGKAHGGNEKVLRVKVPGTAPGAEEEYTTYDKKALGQMQKELEQKLLALSEIAQIPKKQKKEKKLFNLTNFDAPVQMKAEMVAFVKGSNLGTIRVGNKDVPLTGALKSITTEVTSNRLLSSLIRHYARVNNLHVNATSNKGVAADDAKKNMLGADGHMKKTLAPIFAKLYEEDVEKMKAAGVKEGDLKNAERKADYQNEWHAFSADNFLLFDIARIVKHATIAADASAADKKDLLRSLEKEVSVKYCDKINVALAANPADFAAYDKALKDVGVTGQHAKIRAAIDHDWAMLKSIAPDTTTTDLVVPDTSSDTHVPAAAVVEVPKANPQPAPKRGTKK